MNNRQLLTAIATGLALLTFERRAVSDAPPVPEAPTAADWTERDNFLGQISMSYVQDSFHDRVDAFSGRLHINMVDVTLPGHGGLDLVVQRYYSSSIWNRADGAYPTHAASSDGRDLLGGSGWQLHMGKIIKPTNSAEPYLAIMPDGSTHPLYSSATGQGWISQERWTLVSTGSSGYDLTLTDGTVYSFDAADAYMDPHSQWIFQCSEITKPGVTSSSIEVEYNSSLLMSKITDTYGRTVEFQYVTGQTRISTMTVKNGSSTLQTWQFSYEYQATFAQANGAGRPVYALTSVQPPVGSPWTFAYNPGSVPIGNGMYALQKATLPTGGSISYTYTPVTFNTGTQACFVQFPVVTQRQLKERDGSTVVGTWSYAYAGNPYPGSDGGTTTVTVKNGQGTTLLTDVSVFNGWRAWSAFDQYMWKVGLPQQRTVTTYGLPTNQTEVETYTWIQDGTPSNPLSWYQNHTTNWAGCGSYRLASGGVFFTKPLTQTRSITREGISYTTTTSNFDSYGNPETVTESVSGSLKRTTELTYWNNTSLNILVGKVATRSASPGAQECFAYDTYGRQTKRILNPSSMTTCTRGTGSLETDFAFDASTGDLTKQTKVGGGGLNEETTYASYSYGQPTQVKVTGTNIFVDRTINPTGTIATATDGRGNASTYRTTFTYDALNRLKTIQPPVSGSLPTTFTYAANWATVTVTRGSHSVLYSFDGLGRLTERKDQQTTHTVRNTYNALGVRTQQQLLYGTTPVDTQVFDALGRLTSLAHYGDGSEVTYSYSGTPGIGPYVEVQDETGEQTSLYYEAFGAPGDTRLKEVSDAAGNDTSYAYNAYNLVSAITAPLTKGNRSFTYDPNLLLKTETHPESGTTTYTYDGLGRLAQKTQAGGVFETYGYDSAGRLTLRASTGSNVTFVWDGASQRTQMSSADGTFDYIYDGNKNLTSKSTSVPGVGDGTMTFTYDTRDRLDTITYLSGRQVRYTYDTRDWVTGVKNPLGNDYASSITRHVNGAIDQISLGNGATTNYDLDSRYRVDSISTSSSAGSVLGLSFTYDDAGNLEYWNDTLNNANDRSFTYDALHRLTGATASGLWGNLGFQYDALGNRTQRTQGSRVTSYTYDANNRLTRATTGSLYESYAYNLRGDQTQAVIPQPTGMSLSPNAVQVRQAGGSTKVTITINGAGFAPTSVASFDGVAKPTTFVSSSVLRMDLTYDDLKVAMIHPVAVVNPARPEPEAVQAAGATLPLVVYFADVPPGHWAYDPVNLIATHEVTHGVGNNNYGPDVNLTRAQMAVFLLTAKHGAGYTPPQCTGLFSDVACPSGFAVNYIEEFYREGITAGCGANPLRFCPDSTLTKQEMAVFLLGAHEPSGYLPPACTGLFADVPCPGQNRSPDYIEETARRGIDTGCGNGNFCPLAPVSRALMAQMVARTWGYQMPYVSPSPGTDTYTYTFNTLNQLTGVQTPSGNVSFTYDGDGQRIKKTGPSGTVVYVRGPGGEVLEEFSGTATFLADYVYVDGQRLCKVTLDPQTEHRVYYHTDGVGTPLAETNESGQLVAKAEYYPFGEEANPGSAADPHKFAGKEYDSEFGLHYFGARYYDSHLGRFISVDPVGGDDTDPQKWNRYAYARNNPLVRIDPDGRTDFYVMNTFRAGQYDAQYDQYFSGNSKAYYVGARNATPANFQGMLEHRDGVSVYYGHSDTFFSLKFPERDRFVSSFAYRSPVTILAACNSAAMLADAKVGPGQAVVGIKWTTNPMIRSALLGYAASQLMDKLGLHMTVEQAVKVVNKDLERFDQKDAKGNAVETLRLSFAGDGNVKVE